MARYTGKLLLMGILMLFGLDQGIKLIISGFFMTQTGPILGEFMYFEPYINTQLSWINDLFDLGLGAAVQITLNILVLAFILTLYSYSARNYLLPPMIRTGFAFFTAGGFCSLIDKIFWGGSLDYIGLKGLFIFDLKDCYLNIGLILFILFLIKLSIQKPNALKWSNREYKAFFTGYLSFISGGRIKDGHTECHL